LSRTRDISNIFDDNSPIVNDNELIIAINTASAAAVSNVDLTSTIVTASAAAVNYLIDGAPGALNTLNELAAALNDDQNFASSVLTTISNASAAALSSANTYTDNATPDLTPAIQAASAAAVAYTDQEILNLDLTNTIVSASAAAAAYTDAELATIDLTSTIITASAAAAGYADNLITNLPPLIAGIAPDSIAGTASTAVVINGQNFKSGSIVKLIDTNNTELFTLSTTFNNARSLQFLTPTLTASAGPYDIKVTNPDNQLSILENALTVGVSPAWSTSSGSLGLIYDYARSSTTFTLLATDADNQNLTYNLVSGSLPTGMSINSGGVISGTATAVASDTTYAFIIRVTDTANNYADRSFSITTKSPQIQSFTSGTTSWIAPATGNIRVLVVAGGGGGGTQVGGGGGAGGLIHNTSFNVTSGQSYAVAVGAGGNGSTNSGTHGANGSNSTFGSLVAIGGGGGGSHANNGVSTSGGSGGGGGGGNSSGTGGSPGTAGQGNSGGVGRISQWAGGGGGGAGAAGQNSPSAGQGGYGGIGLSIDITGTAIFYAGGGGGCSDGSQSGSDGGNGGGGAGRSNAAYGVQNATANTGGGGGGIRDTGTAGNGGSGIVVIKY